MKFKNSLALWLIQDYACAISCQLQHLTTQLICIVCDCSMYVFPFYFVLFFCICRCGADTSLKNNNGHDAEQVLEKEKPDGWEENLHWYRKLKPGIHRYLFEPLNTLGFSVSFVKKSFMLLYILLFTTAQKQTKLNWFFNFIFGLLLYFIYWSSFIFYLFKDVNMFIEFISGLRMRSLEGIRTLSVLDTYSTHTLCNKIGPSFQYCPVK